MICFNYTAFITTEVNINSKITILLFKQIFIAISTKRQMECVLYVPYLFILEEYQHICIDVLCSYLKIKELNKYLY